MNPSTYSNLAINFWLYLSPRTVIEAAYGGQGNDQISGNYWHNIIGGDAGSDRIWGNDGNDTIVGDYFNDNGNDYLIGGNGYDTIFGGNLSDTLSGGNDNDALQGDYGNDLLYGGAGSDDLYGNKGRDVLEGGTGADVYHFGNPVDRYFNTDIAVTNNETSVDNPDLIRGFEGAGIRGGDVIDLTAMNPGSWEPWNDNGSFAFAGIQYPGRTTNISPGALWVYDDVAGNTVIKGNCYGDSAPDFAIVIQDGAMQSVQYTTDDIWL